MDDIERSSICKQDDCDAERELYCNKCQIQVCRDHGQLYHKNCQMQELRSKINLKDAVKQVKELLDFIRKMGRHFPSIKYAVADFHKKLDEFWERFTQLLSIVEESIKEDDCRIFSSHYEDIIAFHSELERSKFYSEYTRFAHTKFVEKGIGQGSKFFKSLSEFREESFYLEKVARISERMDREIEGRDERIEALEGSYEECKTNNQDLRSQMQALEDLLAQKDEELKSESEAREEERKKYEEEKKTFEDEKERLQQTVQQKDEEIKAAEQKCKDISTNFQNLEIAKSKIEKDSTDEIKSLNSKIKESDKNHHTMIEMLCGKPKKDKEFNENKSQLMETLTNQNLKHPDTEQFWLTRIHHSDKLVNTFLKVSFPYNLKSLVLNWVKGANKLKMSYFIENLARVIGRVSCEVVLGFFVISEKDLEKIINNCKCSKLIFHGCYISPSQPLSFTNSSLTHLSFQYCGHSFRGDWAKDENRCRHIMKAIGGSKMKTSLQKINVFQCGFSTEKMKEIGGECGIDKDKIDDFKLWEPMDV